MQCLKSVATVDNFEKVVEITVKIESKVKIDIIKVDFNTISTTNFAAEALWDSL